MNQLVDQRLKEIANKLREYPELIPEERK